MSGACHILHFISQSNTELIVLVLSKSTGSCCFKPITCVEKYNTVEIFKPTGSAFQHLTPKPIDLLNLFNNTHSGVPATKSAHGGSQSAAPATKSAHGGSQSAAPAAKSAPGGSQSAAPATKSGHGGSQSAVPATKSALRENSNPNGGTIPTMPDHDPSMTRDRLAPVVPQSQTCRRLARFEATGSIEKYSISCVRYLSKTHFVLRLPRILHLEVHKVLCLPRNLHMEVHKALCLLRNLRVEVHKVLRLPQNLHLEVHKVLRLPRNLSHLTSGV